MFWRKRTFIDSELGLLTFSIGSWDTEEMPSSAGPLTLSIAGSKSAPDSNCLKSAKQLLISASTIVKLARDYVSTNQQASEFIANGGDLVLDGVDVLAEPGKFRVLFGLSGWEDASIVVCFVNGHPHEVLLGD